MLNPPVHWYEGMFLRPQHFQAAERYWGELMSVTGRLDHSFNYGIREISFSQEAIQNGQFELNRVEGRLPDGTAFSLDTGESPGRIDLQAAFAQSPTVTILLAVPKLNLGRPNVAATTNGRPVRFAPVDLSIQDESAGGNAQDVQFRTLNVRLMLSTEDLAGYDTLPIARVRRATEIRPTPAIDDDYFPPMLSTAAWTDLDRGIIRAIYDIVGNKVSVLSEQVRSRSITLAAQEAGDLDRIFMLQILNEAWGKLSCMAFVPGIHPLPMYTELCRLIGALAVFAEERTVREYPRYNHDDLATIYKWAKRQLEDLIGRIRNYGYEQRPFIGDSRDKLMRVKLDPKWLGPDWEWYVGINGGEAARMDVMKALEREFHNWKLGAEDKVESLFKDRREALNLKAGDQVPRALPVRGNWIYYKVTRGNKAWDDVVLAGKLAMRFREDNIVNLANLDGQQRLDLKSGTGVVPLEFSLFAVQKQMS